MLVTNPMLPLHRPLSKKLLFRSMTRAPGCKRTVCGRLVLPLKRYSAVPSSHGTFLMVSSAVARRNWSGVVGSMLQTDMLIELAHARVPTR